MNCPQTYIEDLEKKITSIRKYGCCAFCTIWALDLDPTNEDAYQMLIDGIQSGALDDDCTVNWKLFTKMLSGEDYEVEMIDLTAEQQNIEFLKNYTGKIIVRFDKGINYHWVGFKDGVLAYNSLIKSICVESGKPTKVRILRKKK